MDSLRNGVLLLVCSVVSIGIGSARAADEKVEFLGDYAHVVSATGEHCQGYNVVLWRHQGSLIGFLNHHRGLCGDPPMGLLEETSYTAATGDLSFRARLSEGCIAIAAGKCVPSKDVVTFKGRLQGSVLEGVMSWHSVDRDRPMGSMQVTLTAGDPQSSRLQNFENHERWMSYWAPILKRRGPQW